MARSRRGTAPVRAEGEGTRSFGEAAAARRPLLGGRVADEERIRRAVIAAVPEALERRSYEEVTFPFLARLAGVDVWDVGRLFGTRAEVVLAALSPPQPRDDRVAFELPGGEIVTRYLEFWEAGANTLILRAAFGASGVDRRLAATIEARTIAALIQPFVERTPATDANPRARLAFSHLLGLGISRYVLRQEPLASADHQTIATWTGPALDYFLRGELGTSIAAVAEAGQLPADAQLDPRPPVPVSRGLETIVIAAGPRVVDDPLRWLDDEVRRAAAWCRDQRGRVGRRTCTAHPSPGALIDAR